MSIVELSDEENVAILAETFTESLSDVGDRTRQKAVLKRLYELLDSNTPQHYIYRRSRPSASGLDPEGEGRKLR